MWPNIFHGIVHISLSIYLLLDRYFLVVIERDNWAHLSGQAKASKVWTWNPFSCVSFPLNQVHVKDMALNGVCQHLEITSLVENFVVSTMLVFFKGKMSCYIFQIKIYFTFILFFKLN